MSKIDLPHDAKAGPTKPEVRSVLVTKLELTPDDHFVDVGSCTGAVSIEAARDAGKVTAIERKPERAETTRDNVAANDVEGDLDVVEAEAPEGMPDDVDVVFLGGSRNHEEVVEAAVDSGARRVAMNVSRLEVAGAAAESFRRHGILDEVLQIQVSHGYDLAGATSFDANNPVYMLIGDPEAA